MGRYSEPDPLPSVGEGGSLNFDLLRFPFCRSPAGLTRCCELDFSRHSAHTRRLPCATPSPSHRSPAQSAVDALYAEYAARGVEFTRGLGNMPWHRREFVVKDCDGRLLAFGANLWPSSVAPLELCDVFVLIPTSSSSFASTKERSEVLKPTLVFH
jgi:hypothetical protein